MTKRLPHLRSMTLAQRSSVRRCHRKAMRRAGHRYKDEEVLL